MLLSIISFIAYVLMSGGVIGLLGSAAIRRGYVKGWREIAKDGFWFFLLIASGTATALGIVKLASLTLAAIIWLMGA